MSPAGLTRVALGDGIELDTLDIGPRDAPALLFLHGFPESHRTWRHQVAHLADRFRCIAPDQRGYRGSSKPSKVEAYAPANLIGDVFGLARALGVERFAVIGHDWGGAIAWGVAMAGQTSGAVTRAVIANAPHPALFQRLIYTNAEQRAASQYVRAFRDPANGALVRAHGLGALLAKALAGQGSLPALDPEERADLLIGWQDHAAAIAMLNWYRASPIDVPPVDAPLTLPDGWEPPRLPKLSIPTLVLWGMNDTALPACNLDGIEEVVEAPEIVRLPGVGHFSPWEAPDKVNAALDAFLA